MAQYTPGLLPDDQTLYLTLDRYQTLMRLCPSAFNGLLRTDGGECCDCDAVWLQSDRDALAIALAQAEEMRERELGYHLSPKYVSEEMQLYRNPEILDKKHLIAIGSQAFDDISIGEAVPLGTLDDPVVINITTSVDLAEIHVYDPDTGNEILPSSIKAGTLAGTVDISIPRPRLITWEAANSNCDPAPRYDDDTNFLATVDIKRMYTDPGTGAFIVWNGGCCDDTAFTEYTQQVYPMIDNTRISSFRWKLGTYTAGVWSTASCTLVHRCAPTKMRISYLSGRRSSISTEIETIRLAHTLLDGIIPDKVELCGGCWKEDRVVSDNLITPYGNKEGAILAWHSDSRAKVGFGAKIPRSR